ncbi:PAS domain S-box-containing protein/diguanylate cyclase (GGDEF) domain-containing protein [Mariprofundus ferrinatatus]|uniref:Sensor protein FixL n=1 Tax=Mariprofundus ferrinatatus TaxID=1921087 RepID=A0A2K8L6Z1_9PROT|nr:diguanylate cyclase [Mariprofundus ferrinatatus]ATX83088.1 PAS domain S-box-containing protein/diguanylate cyclase (GGDEF) domain-containing protein [Mariprofundus ferrinatatus]
MQDMESKPQPTLIIGGGHGGTEFLKLLLDVPLYDIIGIADINADAPAFKIAEKFNIPIYHDAEEALNACRPCTAFNFTNNETISEAAAAIIGPSSIIGGHEAYLIWKMAIQMQDVRNSLEKSMLLTEAIVSSALEGIIVIDSKGIVKVFNPAAERLFGFSQAEVIGSNINMLMAEPDRSAHDSYIERYLSTRSAHVVGIEREVDAMHKNGRIFPISLSVSEMVSESENENLFVGIVADISERKKNEASMKKLVHFDPLTGLANRTLYYDRLSSAMAQAKRQKQEVATLFLDLDGFKAVNDTHGHEIGDLLLREVACRLLRSTREVDTVARFGGDEFAFVLVDVKGRENVTAIVDKLITLISEPYKLNDHKCIIGGSIGISIYPEDSEDMSDLINQADSAMYAVKKSGKNAFRFYDKSMSY